MACFTEGCCPGGGGGACTEPACPGGVCSSCNPEVSAWYTCGIYGILASRAFFDVPGLDINTLYFGEVVDPATGHVYGPPDLISFNRVPLCMKGVGGGVWKSDPLRIIWHLYKYPMDVLFPDFVDVGLGLIDLVMVMTLSGSIATVQQIAYVPDTTTVLAIMGTWQTLYPFDLSLCDTTPLGAGTIPGGFSAMRTQEMDHNLYPMPCSIVVRSKCCFANCPIFDGGCPNEYGYPPQTDFFLYYDGKAKTDCGRAFKCNGLTAMSGPDFPRHRQVYITLHASGACSSLDGIVIPIYPCGFFTGGGDPTGGVGIWRPNAGLPGNTSYNCDGEVAQLAHFAISVDYVIFPDSLVQSRCKGTCTDIAIGLQLDFSCRHEMTLRLSLFMADPQCPPIFFDADPNTAIICGDVKFYGIGGRTTADLNTISCDPLFIQFNNIMLEPANPNTTNLVSACLGPIAATLSE